MPTTLTENTANTEFTNVAETLSDEPYQQCRGKGVVIPAGGSYLASAWVAVRMLRHLGCTLPIELWHLGPEEITEQVPGLFHEHDVRCVDAIKVAGLQPVRRIAGWELKPFAILNSSFREVLLLDADNVPVVDPTFLFETEDYKKHGAIFWPDYGVLHRERLIWNLTGVPFREEPEFESGQIVIDKARTWRPLRLTMWMNEHSDFWYRYIHGDKDTFHLCWRKLEVEYGMPDWPIFSLPDVMCQHDFDGRRLFQHRNSRKWRIDGLNLPVPGFTHEPECLEFLQELRTKWTDRPNRPYIEALATPQERQIADQLCSGQWIYRRIGSDERVLAFNREGLFEKGAAGCEQNWHIERFHLARPQLVIRGEETTCSFVQITENLWEGRWMIGEQMPVALVRLKPDRLQN